MRGGSRVAFVTGGAGAIGSAVATMLAESGMRVAVGYRSSGSDARSLAEHLPGAVAIAIDVQDRDSVRGAFETVRSELGPVSILVNSAGITRDQLLLRMTDADWQQVIETNLTGAYRCVREVIDGMVRARFGRIVTIGSISGALAPAGQANYAAAKAGLVAMTKALSREVARRDVTANVVAPGLIASEISAHLDPKLQAQYVAMTATRRPVDPVDVALAVSFCVQCPSLTGQVINVDGGITWNQRRAGARGDS